MSTWDSSVAIQLAGGEGVYDDAALGCSGEGVAVDMYVDLATLCSLALDDELKSKAKMVWGASLANVLARCFRSRLWRRLLRLTSKPWCDGACLEVDSDSS